MSEPRFPTPAWAQEVMDKYGSGVAHAFVLHFGVHDYAVPGVPFTTYLAQMLAGRQVVAVYSRDLGITFPLETMRERFVEILGLGDGQSQQPADPAARLSARDEALAALQSLGVAPAGGGTELPRAPADALPLLGRLLRAGGPEDKLAAVVIEEAQTVVPDADVAAMSPADRDVLVAVSRWGRDAGIVAAGNPVFLVTPNLSALNGAVRAASSKWEAIKVSLPGPEERLAFVEWYLEERPDTFTWPEEMTPQMLANVTAGLSLVHLEDILLRAEAEGELRPEMVRERKEAIIRSEYGDVLEVMEPRFGFDDIGGLAHVKEFFTRSVIRPMQEGRTRRVPQGVLMTGPAGCIQGDTRIHLADGRAIRIEDLARNVSPNLEPGVYPFGREILLKDGQPAMTQALHIYADQPVLTITLKNGRQITCTLDHPLLTTAGWCRARDLEVGRKVRIALEIPAYGEQPQPLEWILRRCSDKRIRRHLKLPEVWTPAIAQLVGLLTAEGSRDSSCRLSFNYGRTETGLIDWTVKMLNDLGVGEGVSVVHRYRVESTRIRVRSVEFYDAFADYLPLSRERTVPEPIFSCKSECIAAYLRGLFEGDGCVSISGTSRKVSLKTASTQLAHDAQLLLARLGIYSRMYTSKHRSPSYPGRIFQGYVLNVTGRHNLEKFNESVGFFSQRKRDKLQRALESYRRDGVNNDRPWVAIASIESGSCERVYDLEVPVHEHYLANGIVSHNTGKSIVAEAIAREAGINAVRLRIGGQIASKWQGEGERNLEKALAAIEGMVPTIVVIDEIDQAVSRGDGSGGSQQDKRIFQRLLEWMSDTGHRGKVVLLAACNRPDLMDAALRRPGRFDKKIPFLVPDEEERRAIFTVMCQRYGLQVECIPDACIAATDGWTGAEIEVATIKGVELVEDENLGPGDALVQAVQRIRPSTADIEYMTLLALKEVGDYDLLPPKYQAIAQDQEKIEKRVEELQVRMRGQREL